MSNYRALFDGPFRNAKVHGKFVVDWRDCADADFVRALRPISACLRAARATWAADPQAGRRLVVGHFLRRRVPRWAFDFRRARARELPSRNFFFGQAVSAQIARRSLRYESYDYNLAGSFHRLTRAVDWNRARVRELGSAGWLTMAFAYWALFPAAGYAMTRDRRYARVFARCWRRWLQDFPTRATDAGLAGWGDFNTRDPAGLDICMNVGRRALVLTDVLYSGMLGAVPAELAFEVLRYLWFSAGLFRMAHRTKPPGAVFRKGNHNLFDMGTVPFCLGVAFPEFDCARDLVRAGRAIIRRHAADPALGAIRPDGTSWEHSSRYGWYAAGMFRQPLELARLNREALLSARQERRVAGFLEHFADLTAPDGSLIPYGDCQPPKPGCQLEPARSLWSATRSEAAARRLGALSACHAPARRSGPPTGRLRTARFFPESGILVARTGWGRRDSLLFVTAEPRPGPSGHSHHDFTSFQLWADGVPLFYDAATWAYRIDEIIPAERGYYYSAFSHNLLTVEGYRPRALFRAMGDVNRWWGDRDNLPASVERLALRGARGELAVGHRSYPDMRVTRRYRFDLARRWLEFTDRVEARRRAPRVFRQWLHLGFGARARCLSGPELRVAFRDVEAVCRWTASEPVKLVLEPSLEVERAARVFRLAPPLRAYVERRTRAPRLEITCRVEWRRK